MASPFKTKIKQKGQNSYVAEAARVRHRLGRIQIVCHADAEPSRDERSSVPAHLVRGAERGSRGAPGRALPDREICFCPAARGALPTRCRPRHNGRRRACRARR
eukprot:scaffold6843_cov149-Isochrysis_galbana.AAC.2